MKIWYLLLVGLSLIVACGNPPPTVTLTASELNPEFGSSVTFTASAAPSGQIAKLELLEGTKILKTVNNAATLEQNVIMDVAGKRSFTARVTNTAGVSVTSAVVEVNTKAAILPVISLSATPDKVFIGGLITLKAIVTASSGIKDVEFFEGIISLGKDLSVPFEMEITDFSTTGNKAFRAVATDNNGLKSEAAITPITVLESVPTSFQLLLRKERIIPQSGRDFSILSPDVTELKAKYEAGAISTQTEWTLQTFNGNPVPVDGSFGTIVAIPGDPNGLRSATVRYVPPVINDPSFELRIFVIAKSVQDPTQTSFVLLEVHKKGILLGIKIFGSTSQSLKINVPIQLQIQTVGTVAGSGLISDKAVWTINPPNAGTLACVPNAGCAFTETGQIVADRVLFTPTTLGQVNIKADSLHNEFGDNKDFTVVP
jgi:hypothetical protein